MIVEIRIKLGSIPLTEENIRLSFDRLMSAMFRHDVREGGHFCRIIDGELNDEATLELRVGAYAEEQFLKTGHGDRGGVLRKQHNTNKQLK